MNRAEILRAARESVVLFDRSDRGLIEVSGSDRVRWLDGMISGDVMDLEERGEGAGCYATLLTNRGAIVADLHVGRLGEVFLLETRRSEVPKTIETLGKFIIADDVELVDRSDEGRWFGLEGPGSASLLASVVGDRSPVFEPESWQRVEIAGRAAIVAGFGWGVGDGLQLRVDDGDADVVLESLDSAAGGGGVPRGDREISEILRVEAGRPLLGMELDEEVLPPEARLEHAISTTKGCYVGQEIVARLRARGQVNHLLVGLKIEGEELPAVGTILYSGERRTGELTSIVRSPEFGSIGLGFVRREHAQPGTQLIHSGDHSAEVARLPFGRVAESDPVASD